jgi:hypothetical protein
MAKHHANEEPRDTPATLVNAFLEAAAAEFADLVRSPGASWSVQVEHATSAGLVPVTPERITGFFFATATFANELVAGSLSFGDREYLVNTVLGPARSTARYALWEWADALGFPALVPRDTSFVLTLPRLSAIVAGMARGVATLQERVATAPVEVFDRLERAREDVRASYQARLREDGHRSAAAAAAEAFRRRDYHGVVVLLEPFGDVLTPAEREKLAFAQRHA